TASEPVARVEAPTPSALAEPVDEVPAAPEPVPAEPAVGAPEPVAAELVPVEEVEAAPRVVEPPVVEPAIEASAPAAEPEKVAGVRPIVDDAVASSEPPVEIEVAEKKTLAPAVQAEPAPTPAGSWWSRLWAGAPAEEKPEPTPKQAGL